MNLYTISYEATQPSPKAVQVPLNSKYAVGVGITINGAPARTNKDFMFLNGLSANGSLDDMAVFNLSSDGTEGREVHEVEVNTTVLSTHNSAIYSRDGAGTFILSGDCSEWIGVPATFSQWALYVIRKQGSTESHSRGGTVYILDDLDLTTTKHIIGICQLRQDLQLGTLSGFTYYTDEEHTQQAYTTDPFTFYSTTGKLYYYTSVSTNATKLSYILDAVEDSKPIGKYKLYIDKKDVGKAEGYLDVTSVYSGTINLSGTLSDDTEFSYDLPIKD